MPELSAPWPWYVVGPLIGLIVPALLLVGGKVFGLSANLRHLCAATPVPARVKPEFLRYDWRRTGLWNLVLIVGIALGAWLTVAVVGEPDSGQSIADVTRQDLAAAGITDFTGLAPDDLFSWAAAGSAPGLLLLAVGGFLVGFGTRYAGGCTSGHAISGLSNLQVPSLVAVLGFFAGGLLVTFGWFR